MGQFGIQVILALAKTLGLRDHMFKRTGITPEISLSLCVLFNNMMSNPTLASHATQAIDEELKDQPGAQERINLRLEQAAETIAPEEQ